MVYFIKVEKQLGSWYNEGPCEAINQDSACGPGNQKQTRLCIDGTPKKWPRKCTPADTERNISCSDAGTPLRECKGKGQ